MINYLQVENLTKSYGDLVLFDNISFTIGEGQRIALIGRNGSGKNDPAEYSRRQRYGRQRNDHAPP